MCSKSSTAGSIKSARWKRELGFFFVWFVIYYVLSAIGSFLSGQVGSPWSFPALTEILFLVFVILVLKKKDRVGYYGIRSLRTLDCRNLLYFIPMAVIAFSNLGLGIHLHDSWLQILLQGIVLAGAGFSEEILFRGFLLRALMNKSPKAAVLVSSLLFGVLHLSNLLAGAGLMETLFQVIYASFFGLMCAMFVVRTGNILPCIICHALENVTSLFLPEDVSAPLQLAGACFVIGSAAFYTWYLSRAEKPFVRD